MAEIVYELRQVEKKRTKGGVTFLLRVPELTVYQGEFLAVVGPSGCGKSTLLDLLALVLAPTSLSLFDICVNLSGGIKRYRLDMLSENAMARIRGQHIGYVLQNGGLLPFLNVRENIRLTADISHVQVETDEFDGLISRLGLGDQLEKKPQHLSGGQRQRVAVARALIHRPAIVLADEPTAAVDYPTALDIRDELKELARAVGSAVVMVTHDQSLIEDIADAEVHFDVQRLTSVETQATVSVQRRNPAGSVLKSKRKEVS